MQLDAEIRVCGDSILVRCHGRIVYGDEPLRIARCIQRMGCASKHVVVDLGAIDAISTGDLGSLVISYLGARAAGYRVVLIRVPAHVMALLNSTGTASVFEIHDDPIAAGLRPPDSDSFSALAS